MNTRHLSTGSTIAAAVALIVLTPVESTRIASIGYDGDNRTLAIAFPPKPDRDDGSVYHYYDVPENVFEAFVAAESKGKFFNSDILGKYDYRRIVPTVGDVKVVTRPQETTTSDPGAGAQDQQTQQAA